MIYIKHICTQRHVAVLNKTFTNSHKTDAGKKSQIKIFSHFLISNYRKENEDPSSNTTHSNKLIFRNHLLASINLKNNKFLFKKSSQLHFHEVHIVLDGIYAFLPLISVLRH